jgi:Mn-containing catalase
MRGPWSSSFGLHLVESEMNGGKGLSVRDVNGKIKGEDRGKQDESQKASTSVGDAKIGKLKRNGAKPDKDGGDGGHDGKHSKKVAFAH